MRTNVYVDAFNLFYGSLRGTPYRWLDLLQLCQVILPNNQINHIRYFTARVSARPGDPQQPDRQNAYLRALATIPNLSIHYGHYLDSRVRMPLVTPFPAASVNLVPEGSPNPHPPGTAVVGLKTDGTQVVRVKKSEEKGSDVNLDSYLLVDGFKQDYEAAVVITNDSDLVEPIRLVRKELGLPVVVLLPCRPPRRPSVELRMVSSKAIIIDDIQLAAGQFPDPIILPTGTITKPTAW